MSAVQALSEMLRSGERDLDAFIHSVCDRVDEMETVLQALLPEPNRRERLLADARALRERYPDPASRPALFGVPVGVKDLFHVDGFETRAGSGLPPDLFAGPEAPVVTRLKEHGALILGKTVAAELAFSEPGPTRNPHNPDHTPGGSSSGSAAAVAADYCPLALGTQTIGSIARPASYCGIVGFKPSYGRIPTNGCVPFSHSVDHVGFFVPDIASVDLVAGVLCDTWSDALPPHASASTWVIGVPSGDYLDQAEPEMRAMFDKAVESLAKAGHEIRFENLFPEWAELVESHYDLIAAEMAVFHRPWFEAHRNRYRKGSRDLIERGLGVSPAALENARDGRQRVRDRVVQCMNEKGIDGWLTPSATGPAPEGLESTGNPRMNLPWTYTGLPTVSVPAGRSEKGLPMGFQWVGRFGEDEQLVRMLNGLTGSTANR